MVSLTNPLRNLKRIDLSLSRLMTVSRLLLNLILIHLTLINLT